MELIRTRCAVCGHEQEFDSRGFITGLFHRQSSRDAETGELRPMNRGASADVAQYTDGRLAVTCSEHTPEECVTAYRLQANLIEQVSANFLFSTE